MGLIPIQSTKIKTDELNAWLVKQAQNTVINNTENPLQVPQPVPDLTDTSNSTNSISILIEKLFVEFQNKIMGDVQKLCDTVGTKLKEHEASIVSLQTKVDQTLQRVCEIQTQIGCNNALPFNVKYEVTFPFDDIELFENFEKKLKDNVAMVNDLQECFGKHFQESNSVTVTASKCLRMIFTKRFAVEQV